MEHTHVAGFQDAIGWIPGTITAMVGFNLRVRACRAGKGGYGALIDGQELRCLKVQDGGEVVTVVISRPNVRNAIDEAALLELDAVLRAADMRGNVRALILTGEGDKTFSAGGDIACMVVMSPEDALAYRTRAHRLFEMMERSPVIFIAAIGGYALGGGLEIALACDIRIASTTARLGLPELGVGLIPGWGGMQRLSRLVGTGVAKDMILTGHFLDADEAWRRGVVTRIVSSENLMDEARKIAERVARLSPIGVRQAKQSINEGREMTLSHALSYDIESAYVNFSSRDRIEGLKAFLDKRDPHFTGE